jgi:hypothetical protein
VATERRREPQLFLGDARAGVMGRAARRGEGLGSKERRRGLCLLGMGETGWRPAPLFIAARV